MDKYEIAQALKETGQLLKAKGENAFKAKAYLTAARTMLDVDEDLGELIEQERLTELPGIGTSIASYIKDLFLTNEVRLLSELRNQLPSGAAELSQIKGLTVKRIALLNRELKVTNLAELEEACRQGKLAKLKGFGLKLQNDILQALSAAVENDINQARLIDAMDTAEDLVSFLRSALKTEKVDIAGGVRRWCDVVDKIVLVAEHSTADVTAALQRCRLTAAIEIEGDCVKARIVGLVPLEVYCLPNLPLALVICTGTVEHFLKLEQHARRKGYILAPDSLRKGQSLVSVQDEGDVFQALSLNFIPPELREGKDEIKLAAKHDFRDLIEIEDIRGMTHCHSTYSDGIHSIEQMARAAQKMGMQYITITDHSPTAHYAGGLKIDRLKQQWEEIDRVQEKVRIKLLKGTECDILADGKLDYPDHILDQFDIIIASIHSRYRQNEQAMTKRLLNGLKNPHFKVWGHPLGRLVLRRPPIPCNVMTILEAIAEARVAIEINGDPYRLDLAPEWAREARKLGLKFIISTDAHAKSDLENLRFGIHMARRAGLHKSDVLNTLGVNAFVQSVAVKAA